MRAETSIDRTYTYIQWTLVDFQDAATVTAMTDAIDDLDIDEHTAACALLDDGPHAGGAQPRRARRTAGPTVA